MAIKIKDLEALCEGIRDSYRGEGELFISFAYGGYGLKLRHDDTSVTDVIPGHRPKKELYAMLQGWLSISTALNTKH